MNAEIYVEERGFTCLYPGGDSPKAEYAILAWFLFLLVTCAVTNRHFHPSLVFVHGLGGHPQKTWSCETKASAKHGIPIGKRIANKALRFLRPTTGFVRSKKKEKSADGNLAAEEQPQPNRDAARNDETLPGVSKSSDYQKVFWPRDLLPEDVNDVRVMTFGYYSNPGGSSQDNLYTLSKNLLADLANERISAVGQVRLVCYRGGFY